MVVHNVNSFAVLCILQRFVVGSPNVGEMKISLVEFFLGFYGDFSTTIKINVLESTWLMVMHI